MDLTDFSPTFDPTGSYTMIGAPISKSISAPAAVPGASSSQPRQHSLPRRGTVPSASQLPGENGRAAVFSTHVASHQYVEHYKAAMDAMRQSHQAERAMLNVEIQELRLRVQEMQGAITQANNAFGRDNPSIASMLSRYSIGSSSYIHSIDSATSLGGEDNMSTSVYGSSFPSTAPARSLSSGFARKDSKYPMGTIREAAEPRRKSVNFGRTFNVDGSSDVNFATQLQGVVVPGELIDPNLDGIRIKATGLPAVVRNAVVDSTNESPSPLTSPPVAGCDDLVSLHSVKDPEETRDSERRVLVEIPSQRTFVEIPKQELNTYAAGHTPLARLHADDASDGGSGVVTPTKAHTKTDTNTERNSQPSQNDGGNDSRARQPLIWPDAPRAPRQPLEHGDSYFQGAREPPPTTIAENIPPGPFGPPIGASQASTSQVADNEIAVLDPLEDPALSEPLALPSDPSHHTAASEGLATLSNGFLNELDKKLSTVKEEQRSQTKLHIPPGLSDGSKEGADPSNGRDDKVADIPLRYKRSTNFGTQFGQPGLGRGIR